MIEVPLPVDRQDLHLDVCTACQFVWFDPGEFEQLPVQTSEPAAGERLPGKARELIALARVKRVAEQARGGDFGEEPPEEVWKWLPGILGMPVEEDVNPVKTWPWLTWALVAVMVVTFILTMNQTLWAAKEFGLVPARLWRYGGLTLLTGFFLHAGLFHLIGNGYFLLVFGDNVEDYLGRWRYVVLVVLAALAGDLLHILGDPGSEVPCVGASGGISGVITFYALRFPRARLGVLVRFRWFHMPAYFALICWFLLQLPLVDMQLAGLGNVSALAHLGGAGIGLGAWLMWRKL